MTDTEINKRIAEYMGWTYKIEKTGSAIVVTENGSRYESTNIRRIRYNRYTGEIEGE
jgi:hypothetical protein